MYVIFGHVDDTDDQPLFWSNKHGWVVLGMATKFTGREKKLYKNLPLDRSGCRAVWVKLPK